MEHTCSHIRKLTKFSVGNGLNGFRIFDNSRISNKKSGNICPILIDVGFDCSCHNRTCHVWTAPWEGLDFSVSIGTVKTGNDSSLNSSKALSQNFIGNLRIKISVVFKADHFSGIHKLIAKVSCHNDTVQVFSSGSGIVFSRFFFKVLLNRLKLIF